MASNKEKKKDEVNTESKANPTDNQTNKTNKSKGSAKKNIKDSESAGTKKKSSPGDSLESATEKTDIKVKKEQTIEEKLTESQDKYLRLSAEFDNYRKRTLKEKMDLTKTAGESLMNNLLPVMDDFERALQLMEDASDCVAMKEGIDLIYLKFAEFLKGNGVKEIDALNQKFDTDMHEAITKIPAASKKLKGKVVDVIQKGYYLNDKVMRYAKVVIGE